MDVKRAIKDRRSVRKYSDKKVSKDLIIELIEAARLAPSGNNAQPWKFFIVQDKKIVNSFREKDIFPQDWVYAAPVIIVCCSDAKAYSKNIEGIDDANKIRALRDLSIASAHIVLRSVELGLGTCYVGWRDEEKLKEILSIPRDYVLPYVITVGYANETPGPRPRKDMRDILLNEIN